jgi:ferredoxin-thioredoxin reductase catalytic subunit
MNALVIHFSMFGNTKQVAEAVAESLESEGAVRVMPVDQLSVADLDEVDLVVMGSPTHRRRYGRCSTPCRHALCAIRAWQLTIPPTRCPGGWRALRQRESWTANCANSAASGSSRQRPFT